MIQYVEAIKNFICMTDHTSVNIAVHLPESKDELISLIVDITGESRYILEKKSREALLGQLGKILHAIQDEKERLVEEHDQTKEYDDLTLAALWRLVDRGVIKRSKNAGLNMPEAAQERIRFLLASIGDAVRFRTENQIGSLGMNRPTDFSAVKIKNKQVLDSFTTKTYVQSPASNVNRSPAQKKSFP